MISTDKDTAVEMLLLLWHEGWRLVGLTMLDAVGTEMPPGGNLWAEHSLKLLASDIFNVITDMPRQGRGNEMLTCWRVTRCNVAHNCDVEHWTLAGPIKDDQLLVGGC